MLLARPNPHFDCFRNFRFPVVGISLELRLLIWPRHSGGSDGTDTARHPKFSNLDSQIVPLIYSTEMVRNSSNRLLDPYFVNIQVVRGSRTLVVEGPVMSSGLLQLTRGGAHKEVAHCVHS